MSIELVTYAEKQAQKAESLGAFGGLNLLHIKRQVASLLNLIGSNGIFDQYTKHDITHIEKMLHNLEWIIPNSSKSSMTQADWLMIVLAIYFHDMGMLVTKAEFEARAKSGFTQFCQQVLFSGQNGSDYKAKIDEMLPDDKDRFLYQEFVRHKHAERIRAWIMGQTKDQLGLAHAAISEISGLLEPIGQQFRRDLGIVCESHHLNDLGDIQKYKVSQPYGDSDAETVNLQYCAVLLRTADLLHVTSDRTPSVEFRIINPSDPVSQQEWAKQMAVKRVRPKIGFNEDGQPDEAAPRDTVEVYAYFTKEDGFFGLTSYLGYAAEQLKKSNEWITSTLKLRLAAHEFPWRRIDDSNIETEGFIRDAFEFTIDQAKILDLLTGHTLYNDTNVVLRELVQNAIDAIRLQNFPGSSKDAGRVSITWNNKTRILAVQDNGTGMTQDIINRFLLRVGTSRYQDPEFIKNNPGFSSISRFGIGVLSAFMIADSVEIISCHPEEEQARRLTLRSVHGKYLIRLMDKTSDDPAKIGAHGTIFRLHVRPSVEMSDVIETARHWVVVPDCRVTVQIDNGDIQRVGYDSPADALRDLLRERGFDFHEGTEERVDASRVRIFERSQNGVSLAYALEWNQWFKEWSFLTVSNLGIRSRLDGDNKSNPLLGTCIEGVRVVDCTPGFDGYSVIALVNVCGKSAPKTNVARSGLEITPERDSMLKVIYKLYAEHIISEISELTTKRSFSPTWASGETRFLLAPLLPSDEKSLKVLNQKLLDEALSDIPCVMIEENDKRVAASPKQLSNASELWTIDCGLLSSAENLIREVVSPASLTGLVKALSVAGFDFPNAPIICTSINHVLLEAVFSGKEVDKIIVNTEHRRVDLRWVKKSDTPRWLRLYDEDDQVIGVVDMLLRQRRSQQIMIPLVPNEGVDVEVPAGEIAVRAFGKLYLNPKSDIANFARNSIKTALASRSEKQKIAALVATIISAHYLSISKGPADQESLKKMVRSYDHIMDYYSISERIEDILDYEKFSSIMINTDWKLFDTWVWKRRTWGGRGFFSDEF